MMFGKVMVCVLMCTIIMVLPLTTSGELINNEINTVVISDITLTPELGISYYGNYRVNTTISTDSGSIDTVLIHKDYINGEGTEYSNYYVNGTPISRPNITQEMDYDVMNDTYYHDTVPDKLYPEIVFARHNDTWYNKPYDNPIWRDNYHLMHFENPFLMTENSSMFFVLNIDPNSITPPNSNDLLVYLIERNQNTTYFEDEWFDKNQTELITSINYNDPIAHQHTENSSHRVVRMTTNPDGTIGNKHLNITDDFWIVLFSNANSISKGWSLRCHNDTIANNTEHWYTGNKLGWTTAHQIGVPDAHIHIARRDGIVDGINFTVIANDTTDGNQTVWKEFFFGELPNFPPNPSLFITPANNTYSGELNVSWYPSLDPNLDDVFYTLVLLNPDGSDHTILVVDTNLTYFIFKTTIVDDGWYDLKVIASDGLAISDFTLTGQNGLFRIYNNEPTPFDILNIIIIAAIPIVIIGIIITRLPKSMERMYEKNR